MNDPLDYESTMRRATVLWVFLRKASRASRESSDLGSIGMDCGQRFLELSKSVEIGILYFVALSQKCKL